MYSDYINPDTSSSPACYFSILPASSSHFSVETPSTTPLSDYSPDVYSDPSHPLLAFRHIPHECHMSSTADVSRLLQLQTAAAHRPAAQPLQHSASASSSDSESSSRASSTYSSSSPSMLCCCRCRRESGTNAMVQFGTNLYYCNHCAKMTGYCAG
ncbi:hypothetical protein BU26DRAFT_514662 [Trematosphaeria pertusa]|uniref:Uncharacterized protein n=1 Tax=Trematosphaeria pertusa TaxID=390896 RepID=A0A6A6IYX8_9PLEO|nr:uncharacterized protein BU26DRAFT_514662 [Trematosphaeria pertusa]KAF2254820.1 hypothetical protein BU26DRAFT_514662 [Trematosphaeria pertusa]